MLLNLVIRAVGSVGVVDVVAAFVCSGPLQRLEGEGLRNGQLLLLDLKIKLKDNND
jgi:hypothetical protein